MRFRESHSLRLVSRSAAGRGGSFGDLGVCGDWLIRFAGEVTVNAAWFGRGRGRTGRRRIEKVFDGLVDEYAAVCRLVADAPANVFDDLFDWKVAAVYPLLNDVLEGHDIIYFPRALGQGSGNMVELDIAVRSQRYWDGQGVMNRGWLQVTSCRLQVRGRRWSGEGVLSLDS